MYFVIVKGLPGMTLYAYLGTEPYLIKQEKAST